MTFNLNPSSNLKEYVFEKNGVKFRFIQKVSKKIGTAIVFNNGKDAETYYNNQGELVENSHGMAHFIEHLLFSSKSENLNWLEKMVAEKWEMNGATGANTVFYYISDLVEKQINSQLLNLMKVAYTLDIDEEIFENEKGVVATEAALNMDSERILTLDIKKDYYGTVHQSHTVAGTPDSVNSIEMDEVISYYKEVYTLDNSTVIVLGNFENKPELVDAFVSKFFENLNYIRNNYEVHVQDKCVKRDIAELKEIKYDKKTHELFSTKVQMQSKSRFFGINFEKDFTPENKFAFVSVLSMFSPLINTKISTFLTEKGFNPMLSMLVPIMTLDSKYAFDLEIGTSSIDKFDEFIELYKSVIKNWRDYLSISDFSEALSNEKYNEIKSLDSPMSSILQKVTSYKLLIKGIVGIEYNYKVDVEEIINEDFIDYVVNSIDFENYIDIHSKQK